MRSRHHGREEAAAAGPTGADHGFTQSSRSLALYRILFAGTSLLVFSRHSAVDLAAVPSSWYHPPVGPFALLGGWPPAPVIVALEAVLALGLVALLVGAWTRAASTTVAITGALVAGLHYASGKVDHHFLVIVALPALLAATSWGHHWSVDARREAVRRRADFRASATWPLQALAVVVACVFVSAGLVKAGTGWLGWDTFAARGWLVAHLADRPDVANPVNEALLAVRSPLLWRVVDVVTVAFELAAAVAVLRRRWFITYLVAAVGFHLGILVVFGIDFLRDMLVYLAFVRLDPLADRLSPALDRVEAPLATRTVRLAVVVAGVAYAAVDATVGWPTAWPDLAAPFRALTGVPVSALITVLVVGGIALVWPRTWRDRSPHRGRVPTWLLGVGAAVVVVQLTVFATVGEPYPAPMGPLFMGGFTSGDDVVVFEQRFAVETAGGTRAVSAGDVIPLADPELPADVDAADAPFVWRLREVRFPRPPVTRDGEPVDAVDTVTRLAMQGHRLASDHLPGYADPLSGEEAAWVAESLQEAGHDCTPSCTLVVEWERERIGLWTGDLRSSTTVSRSRHLLEAPGS